MPQKVLINFSDAQIAKLGECKTAAEFQAAVDSVIEASGAAKTEQKVILMEDVQKIFTANIATCNAAVEKVSTDLKTVSEAVAKVDPAALLASAEAAGSKAAAKALGKLGASGADATNANSNDGSAEKSATEQLIAQGKFEEAWAADKTIQAQFSDPKNYAGYMKAMSKGSVKILSR